MNRSNQAPSAPRGAADATPVQAPSGQPAVPWWVSLREGLQLASRLVIASPVLLPAKVVTAARYVHLALGLWESFDARPGTPADTTAGQNAEAEAADAP